MSQITTYWWLIALAAVLGVATVTDLRRGKIYNVLTYSAVAAGLAGHTLTGGLQGDPQTDQIGLASSVLGLIIGAVPLLVAALLGGVKGGDVKLMGAVGALAGPELAATSLVLTLAAAALLSVALMVYHRIFWRTLKRIGLFALQVLSGHRPTDPSSPDSPKVPFALAACIGTVAAVALAWSKWANELHSKFF